MMAVSPNANIAEVLINTSLVDVIHQKIRDNILTGHYEPGQKLIVRDLEEEMNVSQTPIKSALHRLAAEGYVEATPRKSMVVSRVSFDEYEWNKELRLALELFVVSEVVKAAHDEPSFIDGMESDMRYLKAAIKEKMDYATWVSYDFSFHMRYVNTHPNAQLRNIYTGLRPNQNSYLAFLGDRKQPQTAADFKQDYADHEKILAAVKQKDAGKLIDAITAHISRPRIPGNDEGELQERISRFRETYRLIR